MVLAPGSCLVVYTDGLIERRGEVIDLGFDRLLGVVGELVVEHFDDLCDELSSLALEGGRRPTTCACSRCAASRPR